MKVIAEKMLQMRDRLKSAWWLIRQKVASGVKGARWQRTATTTSDEVPALPGSQPWWRVRLKRRADGGAEEIVPAAEAAAVPISAGPGQHRRRSRLARVLRIAAMAVGAFFVAPYILVPLYSFVDPPFSALMVRQAITGADIRQEWVDIEDISPHLVTAVLLAEDSTFCRHHGVDWSAVNEAIENAEDGETPRGASTITMQTAKNLFLWPGQDYVRKGLEVPLAYYMSAVLPKRRVAEIYLNIAEWGPGIFGAEAAARYHFGKSAAALSPTEAALLAASLPSPVKRHAGRPNARLARIAAHIEARMEREAHDIACVFE